MKDVLLYHNSEYYHTHHYITVSQDYVMINELVVSTIKRKSDDGTYDMNIVVQPTKTVTIPGLFIYIATYDYIVGEYYFDETVILRSYEKLTLFEMKNLHLDIDIGLWLGAFLTNAEPGRELLLR